MSKSPTTSASALASQQDKAARLSEQQKKDNHILSEQKRRQAIRAGFDRLADMIPGMEGQGRSEANVLEAAVREIQKENVRKVKLQKIALAKGISKEEFDAAYTIHQSADGNIAEGLSDGLDKNT